MLAVVAMAVAAIGTASPAPGAGALPAPQTLTQLSAVAKGLTAAELETLAAGGLLLGGPRNSSEARFATAGAAGRRVAALADTFDGTVNVESARLVRPAEGPPADLGAVAARLLDVETLSGVTYYSERKKGIAVLFDDVYRVDAPGSRTRAPVPPKVGVVRETTIHLKDSNFGSSWYSVRVEETGEGLLFSFANARQLNFMVIRAFDVAGVRMLVQIVPVREGLYVASMCAADPSGAAAAIVDMYSAMEKRLKAVQDWVVARMAGDRP